MDRLRSAKGDEGVDDYRIGGSTIDGATVADFRISIPAGRALLASLQQVVAQDQAFAYDELS